MYVNQEQCGKTLGPVVQEGQIAMALVSLDKEISILQECIGRLENKISPILLQNPTCPGIGKDEGINASALATEINLKTNRLRSLRAQIEDMTARCEL